jgi:hypothetical protein
MPLYIVYIKGIKTITDTNTNCQHLYFQRSTCIAGVKIFSHLLCKLTDLMNEKEKSETLLRRHLNTHTSYAVDEIRLFKNDS